MPQEYTQSAGRGAARGAGQDAGLARRLAAIAYDTILVVAVLLIASLPWAVAGVTPRHALYPLHVACVYMLAVFYFAWFWTHGGQTPGMKIWRICVVGDDGRSIGWRAALVRSAAALLSWAPLGGGFIWAIFDRRRLAWHDRLSKSRIIRIRRAPKVAHGVAADTATGAETNTATNTAPVSSEAPAPDPPEADGGEHDDGQKRA